MFSWLGRGDLGHQGFPQTPLATRLRPSQQQDQERSQRSTAPSIEARIAQGYRAADATIYARSDDYAAASSRLRRVVMTTRASPI